MPNPHTYERDDLIQPNAANRYEVAAADLPLTCPMPGMYLWNSHPKVYIPLHKTGEGRCMYCGAEYVLKDFQEKPLEVQRQHRREAPR
ncbi:zinc-finger domain-containing protein [Alkalilimnicola sp. S0819]|uniref:zinc-finger domain-containing protein n=1 Tax=Alkalilimnicola sp. S0819 TaxID=2613922 RepID=UPI0012626340|nr:zinc-finger domain-containing protein [Alkalilimnicola sp. S0819]KAB7627322.1 zinc-finger domain-containing protein [Alkalilimnicola sp. S0819]MPQ16037.1 zinc-finger domain-containing protein [Alkalilimnicola sp. S0819]